MMATGPGTIEPHHIALGILERDDLSVRPLIIASRVDVETLSDERRREFARLRAAQRPCR